MPAPRCEVQTVRMALSDAVGAWMDAYAVPRETAIYELQRLAAELQHGLNCNREWRLQRLEKVLGARCPELTGPVEN